MTKTKQKSWLWALTWPFAHANYTIVHGTIYYPKGRPPSQQVLKHEAIHAQQAKRVGGWTRYYFRYLFALPLFWNPFRYSMEWEAYTQGSGIQDLDWIDKKLRSAMYGFLIFHGREKKDG